jgi:predicted phosphodiesterase
MKVPVTILFLFSLLLFIACDSRIAPNAASNSAQQRPTIIAVISDLNSSYGSVHYNETISRVIQELAIIKPDIILCAGDMVAGQKRTLTESNIIGMWKGFKETVLDPIQQLSIPFGFTLGNHDASPTFHTDRRLANEFWNKNVAATNLDFADSSHYPFYFSYIKENIFFMSWDASSAKVPAEVYRWMKAQLKTQTATKARLRILTGHLPLYPIVDAKNKPGEVNAAADSSLAFFIENGLDLYISGHQHAFYPAGKNGLSLLNAGAIGEGERKIMGHYENARKAYTIIEVPVKAPLLFTYKTYDPVIDKMIDPAALPDSVTGFNGTVIKDIR